MTTPRRIMVALMGYARSGKDTAATGLVRDLGFARFALADPLKGMALDIDPELTCGSLSNLVAEVGWDAAKSVPSVRRFLQRLGTEGIRKYVGEDFWVKTLLARSFHSEYVVVPDVRFSNELWSLRHLSGYETVSIWIQRDGLTAGDHASENTLCPQDADIIICNRLDETHLQEQVVNYIRDYFGIH